MRILLVEDDKLLVNVLTKSLNARNYSVDAIGDGVQAWEYLSTIEYDLVILDVLLPNLDGVSLCRRLRAGKNDTPILILTAQNHSQAKVRGLDAGADDYLAKPFDIEELMARIRALLRRRGGDLFPVLQCGGLLLDPAQCCASYEGIPLPLSTKEFALLELFLHNPQHVFSISEILDSLWSSDEYPAEATVRSHIRRLRSRLIEAGAPKDFIANVHGRGYFLKVQAQALLSQDKTEVIDERQFALQNLSSTDAEQQYQSFLEETWQQFYPKAQMTLTDLAQTLKQIKTEKITIEASENAYHLAHRLAGTIGLFNQEPAQKAARELETFFESLAHWLTLGCYADVRSRFETSAAYLDNDNLDQRLAMIQSACRTLSSHLSRSSHHCLFLLNTLPELTQKLTQANQSLGFNLSVIHSLADLRPSLGHTTPISQVLLVPFAKTLENLTHQEPHLVDIRTKHQDLLIIGIGDPVNFETRLQAIRLGLSYILDPTQSAQALLEQSIQLTCPLSHQTHALLIDDDETWLQLITQRFESFGFQVTSSSTPERFWEILESCHPDVLILDVKMPTINGLELCRVLRSHTHWQSLPVIFVSTASDYVTQIEGLSAGADEFISKQLHSDIIIRRVLQRLKRYNRYTSSPHPLRPTSRSAISSPSM